MFRRASYIVLPVELFFYSPPAVQQAPPSIAPPVQDVLRKPKEPEDIAVPKKTVKTPPPPAPAPSRAEPQPQAKPMPGADQAARSTASGGQISLDTAQFPYTYYTNMIVKKIGRNWQWGTGFGQMKTVLYFKIRRSGDITDVGVKKSSGDRLFDQQAVRAIKLSSPFPPLPDGYSGDDLGVFFEFGFKE